MKMLMACLLILCAQLLQAQKKKPITVYTGIQYTSTLKDATKGNNPWGIGAFLTAYGNTGGWLRPVVELTGDVFLEDDKVARVGPADALFPRIDAMVNVMGGGAVSLNKFVNVGFVTGPAFINGDALWAIKPNLNLTPSNGKFLIRLSYLQTNKRIRASSTRHLMAFTVGLGFRLVGK